MTTSLPATVAIDCGNSSIRIVLGHFDGKAIVTTLIDQIPHREILVNGVWHWDILFILDRIKAGLRTACEVGGGIVSAGIATWGIDHGLLAKGGLLLGNPFCYRNAFGDEGLSRLSPAERRFLFDRTGICPDRINTIFQILGYRERFPEYWHAAHDLLLIPDLLNWFLTGERNTDASIASTSQLYAVGEGGYAPEVLDAHDIKASLLPPVTPHGAVRGMLRRELAEELDITPFPVISVPGHDTAAAVAAIPSAAGSAPLFISSGTWSLIGVERSAPLMTDAVYEAGLTNEAAALGTVTLLRNSAGLFMAQRLRHELERERGTATWEALSTRITVARPCGIVDPNHAEFFNPSSMRAAIAGALRRDGCPEPANDGEFFRVVYDSLADSYRETVQTLEAVTGAASDTLHIIGGGSRNRYLNGAAARATGKRVVAGPSEATSLGILACQLLHGGHLGSLDDIRAVAAASAGTEVFEP